MAISWAPDELGVQREGRGPIGGDVQVSDQWSIRFRPSDEPADGTFALVTSYWFVDNYDDGDTPEEDRTYGIQNSTEFMICTDPDDPGSTEVWCDYEYDDTNDARSFTSIEEAEVAAEAAAKREALNNHINWDGRTRR